jgi:hypothetical protein
MGSAADFTHLPNRRHGSAANRFSNYEVDWGRPAGSLRGPVVIEAAFLGKATKRSGRHQMRNVIRRFQYELLI